MIGGAGAGGGRGTGFEDDRDGGNGIEIQSVLFAPQVVLCLF